MKTLQEVQQEIFTEKDARPELSGLNTTSKTAEWLSWVNLFATIQWLFLNLFEAFKTEITDKVASRRLGTAAWYVNLAKDFQLGDALPENGIYTLIDESKRIITRAAFRENSGVLTLKVAKGTALAPVALSAPELVQFKAYISKMKFAGTSTNIISLNADILTITADIYYDSIYDVAQTKTLVAAAVVAYLESLSFDALFIRNELIEQIRNVRGVNDCAISTLTGNGTRIERGYDSLAGYIKYTPNLADFTLI